MGGAMVLKEIVRGILIAVGSVLVLATVGGAYLLMQGTASIEDRCTLNGLGDGHCNFTNTGRGKGARCGQIKLQRVDDKTQFVRSSTLCSGQLEPSTTTRVEFDLLGVKDLCDAPDKPWTQVCEFEFVPM